MLVPRSRSLPKPSWLSVCYTACTSCESGCTDFCTSKLSNLIILWILLSPYSTVYDKTYSWPRVNGCNQVLKPSTREKLRFEGEMYRKVLLEYLQTIPSFLGGNCKCQKCLTGLYSYSPAHQSHESNMMEPSRNFMNVDDLSSVYPYGTNTHLDCVDYDQVLKKAIISMLMVLIFVSFLMAMYGPEIPLFSIWGSWTPPSMTWYMICLVSFYR